MAVDIIKHDYEVSAHQINIKDNFDYMKNPILQVT